MIRFMIDTDDLSKLTGHVELLATYADLVTDLPALEARYPNSQIILINRHLGDPTGLSSVVDIERGAANIPQALAWYDTQHAKGIPYLTTYHDRNDILAVETAFKDRPHFNWDATLDGQAHIPGYDPLHSPAVVQCLSADDLGYHADGSLVLEDNWHPTRVQFNLPQLRQVTRAALAGAQSSVIDLHRMTALLGV